MNRKISIKLKYRSNVAHAVKISSIRYSQLLALRATSKQQHLNQNQIQLLRVQIMAYRSLARNQPLTKQIQAGLSGSPGFDNSSNAGNTRRSPPQCPTPPASPYQQPPTGPMQNQAASSMPPHQQPPGEIDGTLLNVFISFQIQIQMNTNTECFSLCFSCNWWRAKCK